MINFLLGMIIGIFMWSLCVIVLAHVFTRRRENTSKWNETLLGNKCDSCGHWVLITSPHCPYCGKRMANYIPPQKEQEEEGEK